MSKSLLPVINRKITTIVKSGLNIKELASDAALLTVDHAKQHGDFEPMARLIIAIPSEKMKKSLLAFYRDFTPVAFSMRDGKLSASKNKDRSFSAIPSEVKPAVYEHAETQAEKEKKQAAKEKRELARETKEKETHTLQQKAALTAEVEKERDNARDEIRALKKVNKALQEQVKRLTAELATLTAEKMKQAA